MTTREQIRRNIAEAIVNSGMPRSELANRLGIKLSTLNNYIKCKHTPKLKIFANLCIILDPDVDRILYSEHDK